MELAIVGGNQETVEMILFGEEKRWSSTFSRAMRSKTIVSALEYERWSIMLMLIKEWKKLLRSSPIFGAIIIDKETWEELKEVLKSVKTGFSEQRNVLKELRRLVDSMAS